MEARDAAIGEIRWHLSPELRSISLGAKDPLAILDAIKVAYGVSSFATRHNAALALLSVKQESSESVAAFIACAHEAQRFLQSTRPPPPVAAPSAASTPTYSLEDADREQLISVLLNTLL
jgi:hypothetical protein